MSAWFKGTAGLFLLVPRVPHARLVRAALLGRLLEGGAARELGTSELLSAALPPFAQGVFLHVLSFVERPVLLSVGGLAHLL